MPKANRNRKSKKAQARNGPRAAALRMAEPTLRGPRQPRTKLPEEGHAGSPAELGPLSFKLPEWSQDGSPAKTSEPLPVNAMMLSWSPWTAMLRQQALMARGLLSVMEAQIQFWSLPVRAALQHGQR
jgi:hypothetical protein